MFSSKFLVGLIHKCTAKELSPNLPSKTYTDPQDSPFLYQEFIDDLKQLCLHLLLYNPEKVLLPEIGWSDAFFYTPDFCKLPRSQLQLPRNSLIIKTHYKKISKIRTWVLLYISFLTWPWKIILLLSLRNLSF